MDRLRIAQKQRALAARCREYRSDGKPDARKRARPVWGEGWERPQRVIPVWRSCPYSTQCRAQPRRPSHNKATRRGRETHGRACPRSHYHRPKHLHELGRAGTHGPLTTYASTIPYHRLIPPPTGFTPVGIFIFTGATSRIIYVRSQ